jgi:hypothetical protein
VEITVKRLPGGGALNLTLLLALGGTWLFWTLWLFSKNRAFLWLGFGALWLLVIIAGSTLVTQALKVSKPILATLSGASTLALLAWFPLAGFHRQAWQILLLGIPLSVLALCRYWIVRTERSLKPSLRTGTLERRPPG